MKLGETAILGLQLIIFLSAFSNVFCRLCFDACSIDLAMYLLNDAPIQFC